VIRAWEKRYRAVEPGRTATNRRFYTDEQIERLLLLRQATLSGRQIGQVAGLTTEELRELTEIDRVAMSRVPQPVVEAPVSPEDGHFAACLNAIEKLDPQDLRFHLEKAAGALPQPRLVEELIVPLLETMGVMWERGNIRVVHEHVASAVIRAFLENLQSIYVAADSAHSVVVGTPLRQNHEIGALIACSTAESEGWKITYFGSGLPAEEIAAAATRRGAIAVALSLVYPLDDPYLAPELKRLRRILGDESEIIVGGRAAPGYSESLKDISAKTVSNIAEFRETLRSIRKLSS
jgi:DNA-binding transcriptional MerR regulator/methylmalonyl-CoA mutase cobalamin-binding subunit